MQMAVIEYSRNVLGYADANSTEMNEHTEHPVVSLMEEQKTSLIKGGTMRLGAWKCDLKADSLAYKIYGQSTISERHRHRYEYNSAYVDELQKQD
jgi:CTP synthase